MNRIFRLLTAGFALMGLFACEPGPNGMGTAPPGVSQQPHDNQAAARRKARSEYYRGPRGGDSGR